MVVKQAEWQQQNGPLDNGTKRKKRNSRTLTSHRDLASLIFPHKTMVFGEIKKSGGAYRYNAEVKDIEAVFQTTSSTSTNVLPSEPNFCGGPYLV